MLLKGSGRDGKVGWVHSSIGYNYRMSNICAGIGRGQMTVAEEHIAHHKHVQGVGIEGEGAGERV